MLEGGRGAPGCATVTHQHLGSEFLENFKRLKCTLESVTLVKRDATIIDRRIVGRIGMAMHASAACRHLSLSTLASMLR